MVNSYKKGYRAERELVNLLESKGAVCHRAKITRFNDNDFFGLYDIACVVPGKMIVWIQVKSNYCPKEVMDKIASFHSVNFSGTSCVSMVAVKKDRKGWFFKVFSGKTWEDWVLAGVV